MSTRLIYPEDRQYDRDIVTLDPAHIRQILPRPHLDRKYNISVILPMYNVAPYIIWCLDSVIGQIDIQIQLIIVNDGSTDESLSIVLNYLSERESKNAVIINQENQGLSAARNIGISFAVSEFIAYLDTDDFMAPEAYATAYNFAVKNDLDLVLFRSMVFNSLNLEFTEFYDAHIWDAILEDRADLITDSYKTPELLMLEPNANTKLIRRTHLLNNELFFPDGLVFEDYPIHAKGILRTEKIGLIGSRFYMYRTNRPGKITDEKSSIRFDSLKIFDQTVDISTVETITPEQGMCILYSLIRLTYWCGTETVLKDRMTFFSQLSHKFPSLPNDWIDAFKHRFTNDVQLILLCALKKGEANYLFKNSIGLTQVFKAAFILIQQRCYRAFLSQTYGYLKNEIKILQKIDSWLRTKNIHFSYEPDSSGLSLEFIEQSSHCVLSSQNSRLNRFLINAPKRMLKEDILKLANNYFSHRLFFPSENSIVLDIDSNSGLFPVYFASLGKRIQVLTVETRQDLFKNLMKTIEKFSLTNIRCFQSLDDALSEARKLCNEKRKHIDLIKMGAVSFDLELLNRIMQEFEVGHLCGEFTGHDSTTLDLYRLSAGSAQSFFWQNVSGDKQIAGYGNKDIEVSIVVPVYNVETYLPKCIESLVNQTIRSKEILLVDDGSTDSSGLIADEWSRDHPEIRVIHQKNAGCAAARSKGLSEARGKYVGFIDSDDWVDAEMFEKLFEAAVIENADVAQCGFRKVYEEDNVIETYDEDFSSKAPPYSKKVFDDLLGIMVSMPSIWRRIYRTEFLKGKGIDFLHGLPRFDDHPFQFEVFMHANKMVAIPGIYYNYRLGRVGQDVAATDERLYVHFDIFKHLREKIALKPRIEFERQLKRVETATHEWALSNIEKRLRWKYQIMAAKDLFHNRLMISRIRILKDAMQESKSKGAKVLVALILSLLLPKR